MNDRAKQIAAKIIADVWPYTWLSAGVMRDCGSTFAWGAGDSCGSANAFIEAIEAAEEAMGVS